MTLASARDALEALAGDAGKLHVDVAAGLQRGSVSRKYWEPRHVHRPSRASRLSTQGQGSGRRADGVGWGGGGEGVMERGRRERGQGRKGGGGEGGMEGGGGRGRGAFSPHTHTDSPCDG